MIYLYGDESNTPGVDSCWAIGFLFSVNPTIHIANIRKIRKDCGYQNRELKFSSTDYSQTLSAIRLLDYVLQAPDLYFKVIIKDNLFFNPKYFKDNSYNLDKHSMAYVSAYSELCRSISPTNFGQHKKLLNLDHKPFRGNTILPKFLRRKDPSVVAVYRRDSSKISKNGKFTGVAEMLQLSDFLTGTILSIADPNRKESSEQKHVKNIYRKAIISRCRGLQTRLKNKQHFYWPNFSNQKINVFYWKTRKSPAA